MAIDVERTLEAPASAPPAVAITMQPPGRERVDWFKRFLDVLTAFILGIGLYFAWDQAEKLTQSINANNNSINISSVASLGNQTMEIDKIFIANPQFSKYFYDSSDIKKSNKNYNKVAAIASLILNYFDTAKAVSDYTSQYLSNSLVDTDAWDNYFLSMFRSSPILWKVFLPNMHSYGRSIRRIAEPVCSSQRPR